MCFNVRVETAKEVLWAAYMRRKTLETAAVASAAVTQLSIQQAHLRVGHMSEEEKHKEA
jgi:hypothetical protein